MHIYTEELTTKQPTQAPIRSTTSTASTTSTTSTEQPGETIIVTGESNPTTTGTNSVGTESIFIAMICVNLFLFM